LEKALSFREARYREKRQKILSNAARIFARKGYEKASLEEIAARLKLSKASLYHYIKSKEELLFLIQLDAIEEARENLERVASSHLKPAEKLRSAVVSHVNVITKQRVIGALRQQELILPKKWRTKIVMARNELERIFTTIIQEGLDSGVFTVHDEKISLLATLGALNGIIAWYSPRGRLSVEEIGEAVADFILNGFGVMT